MDAYHSPPDKETTNSYPRDGGPGEGSSQLQSHCFASALGLQSRCEVSTVLWEHRGPPTRCWLIKRKGGNVRALKNSSHNDQNNQLFSHHLCFIQLGFLTKIDFPLWSPRIIGVRNCDKHHIPKGLTAVKMTFRWIEFLLMILIAISFTITIAYLIIIILRKLNCSW